MIENRAQIHGHEVIEMMMTSGKSYSRETLRADIIAKFGSETRFFTCSAEGMTADELITFLEERDKFQGQSESFEFDPSKKCDH